MSNIHNPTDFAVLTYQSGKQPAGRPAVEKIPVALINWVKTDAGGSLVRFQGDTSMGFRKGLFTESPATIAAYSKTLQQITPVDLNNTIGAAYYINANRVRRVDDSTVLSNANGVVAYAKDLGYAIEYTVETGAALIALFNAAGPTGSYWDATAAQTVTGNKTVTTGDITLSDGSLTITDADNATSLGVTNNTATSANVVSVMADGVNTGNGIFGSFDALTSGAGVNIGHTTTPIVDGGSLLRARSTSVDTGGLSAGTVLDVQSSGQLAGTVAKVKTIVTTGTAMEVSTSGAYTGTAGVLNVSGTNSTTGDLVVFTGGGAGQTTSAGSVLQVNNAGATDGSDVEINHATGIYTGTKGILDINAGATTTGTIVDIDGQGITTGKALAIAVGAGSSGPAIHISGNSGIEHAGQMKMISATPSVGSGWSGALVKQWACYGRYGGTTATGIIKTEFHCDLTGLVNSMTLNNIIGDSAAANAHFGQITGAVHGTIFSMEILCTETPAGGDPDIDIATATVGTGAENSDVTALTGYVDIFKRGASWAAGDLKVATTALPAAGSYLYMAVGAGAAPGTYTAGKFKITFYGL